VRGTALAVERRGSARARSLPSALQALPSTEETLAQPSSRRISTVLEEGEGSLHTVLAGFEIAQPVLVVDG
jgi:hypothetical protein